MNKWNLFKFSVFKLFVRAVTPPSSLATEYSPNFEAPVRWCPKGGCLCSLSGAVSRRPGASATVGPLTIVWEVAPYDLRLPSDMLEYIRTGQLATSTGSFQ